MNAFGQLAAPNPTTSKLVAIPSFIEKNVTGLERKFPNLIFGCFDIFYFRQIQMTALNICNSEVRYQSCGNRKFAFLILRYSTFYLGDSVESCPFPSFR